MRLISNIDCGYCHDQNALALCEECGGKGYLQIRFSKDIPYYLSLSYVKFDPLPGLFGVFLLEDEILGVGNVDISSRSLVIYDLQSFKGIYGQSLMVKSLCKMESIHSIHGFTTSQDAIFWEILGADIQRDKQEWTFTIFVGERSPIQSRYAHINWSEYFDWFDSATDMEADFMMRYTPPSLRKEQVDHYYSNGFYLVEKSSRRNLSLEEVFTLY
ncbi:MULTISPECIES: hypothetical protein [Bacillaceae]|uniref:hypothetical protein n=1 Tax=Bacillaceae TaxID=186817 RepID=UPI000BFC9B19|nr:MULTISPECIES: hypothetical protein [Bacillaceae]PGT81011.1 hypothetical protein COD11_19140 [Bacillus sp. AFS040349]UGB33551.1 hypothetical protein LPC09_26785 [Metabacillus sp. B2-18]